MKIVPYVTIGSFCKTTSGITPARSNPAYYGGDIPWIKSGELDDCDIASSEEFITKKAVSETSIKISPRGSVLIAMYGATAGKTAFLNIDATTNQAICNIIPDPSVGSARYVWFALRAQLSTLLSKRVGGAQPNINQEIIRNTTILLPDINAQRRIAAILDKADAIRRMRRDSVRIADELLRSTFLEMFGDPVTNPKGWKVQQLGDICDVTGGLQVTAARAGNPISIPYLRVANVFRDRLALQEIKEILVTESEVARTALKKGDVLVVEGHGNPEELGRAAVWNGAISLCSHQNHLIRIHTNADRLRPIFLSAFLNSSSGRAQMLRLGKTTSGLNTISTNNVRSIKLLIPPLAQQESFEHTVLRTQQLSERLGNAERQTSTLFETLLHRAFRGELTFSESVPRQLSIFPGESRRS